MSEGRCCKGSDIGGQQSPWQQGDLHGNRATAQSGPSYQYNTDKLVWNEYLLKKWEGGMDTKQGIERELHGDAPANLPRAPRIRLLRLPHWLGFNLP